MNLYIKLVDGQPVDHPIVEDNFIQAYPEVDINNLPETFAKFVRKPEPKLQPYEVLEGSNYVRDGDVITDNYIIREMTTEEKLEKQSEIKDIWASNPDNPPSWTFDETLCQYVPPVPYPNDGKFYLWSNAADNWILAV